MQQLIDKYKSWHKNTDHSWKVAVIEKCRKEGIMYIDTHQDIDWLYDDCIDYLFDKTTRKITNLAKKLGYSEPPCDHCKNIIKFWGCNEDWKWSPDKAHLFNSENTDKMEEIKQKQKEQTIYDLELHETLCTKFGIVIMRVPSGWIYDCWDTETDNFKTGVFVPFDNRFQIVQQLDISDLM